MAYVEQRGKRWKGIYRDASGAKRSKVFDRKRDAEAFAREQERSVQRLEWTDPSRARVTVGEVATDWRQTLDLRQKTLVGYDSILRCLILPRWGEVRLDRVTHTDVRKWLASLTGVRGQPLSPARRRQAFQVFSQILDTAVEDGRLPKNPAKTVSGKTDFLPKMSPQKADRYLTPDEVQALADTIDPHYRTLILFLAYTGLRWGEVTALRVQHVDMLRKRILVRGAVSDVNGELIYGPTKTHAVREVHLPNFLVEQVSRAMEGKGAETLLFTTPGGAPLRNQNFSRRHLHPAWAAANIPRLTLHDLRHTATSLAINAGANVMGVQKMLGHESAEQTLSRYAHLFDSHLEDVASRLDAVALAAAAPSSPPGRGGVPSLRRLATR